VNNWSVIEDGFATGPVEHVEDGERVVTVSAVWTDEDGVSVSVDSGDEPLPARMVDKVWATAGKLAALAGPAFALAVGVFAQGAEMVSSAI
jgi:hypothetical protein